MAVNAFCDAGAADDASIVQLIDRDFDTSGASVGDDVLKVKAG